MKQSTVRNTDKLLAANSAQKLIRFPNSVSPRVDAQIVPEPPSSNLVGGLDELLFKLGVEPSLTVREAAALLRWSYWKARRYFRQVEGICVCYQPRRYKRAYRMFTIPVSIFAREWQKMTGRQPESAQLIRDRFLTSVK